MAEQKSEDTKQPLARLGARPFVGPTGAPGAARPFLRPASSGPRPAPGPFAPRPVTTRPPLGIAPAPAPETPNVPTPIDAAPAHTTPDVSMTVAVSGPEYSGEMPGTAVPNELSDPHPVRRPITSETVAFDAVDAFDALWGTTGELTTPTPDAATVGLSASPPPLDESALGTLDAPPSTWSDDITGAVEEPATLVEPAASDAASRFEMPAWLADDDGPMAGDGARETPGSTAAHSLGVETAAVGQPPAPDFAEPATDVETTSVPAGDLTPAWLEAANSPPPADELVALSEPRPRHEAALGDRPRFELVEDTPSARSIAAVPNAPLSLHVSAALDRLADRIRSGEIDVSSIAPGATDAAMLASVLAAILRGSSSR